MTDWDVFWKFMAQLSIVAMVVMIIVFGGIEAWNSSREKKKDQ